MILPWYAWALAAMVLSGVWGALIGMASRTGTALGVLAGAVVVEAVLTVPFWAQIRESASWALVGGGTAGVLAYGCTFMALRQPDAPTAPTIALTAMYPVVTALLAWLALGENLSPRQLAGVVLAVIAGWLVISD